MIMNSVDDINSIHIDDAGRRGHDKKITLKRFRLYIWKYVFSWNSLPAQHIVLIAPVTAHVNNNAAG